VIGTALRLELRRSRSLATWLAIVVLLYAGVIAAFYPVIRDNVGVLEDYMKVFPQPLLAAFGMEGNLADHAVFFNTYLGSMLWPIVAAIAGAVMGTRTVAADLDNGFLELPLATRLSRTAYLAAAIGGQLAVLAVLSFLTVATVLVVGAAMAAGFDAGRFLLGVPSLFLFACAVSGVATLLSVVTLRRGLSGGVVAGILLVMYLLDAVSKFRADLDWLGTLSAFRYLRSTSAIDQGVLRPGDLGLFAAVALAAWILALWLFRRRDLVA
jgi:ABC-2 type transport system permease protein